MALTSSLIPGTLRSEFLYFGAQTLRTKIAFDFPQLPEMFVFFFFFFAFLRATRCITRISSMFF